MNCETIDDLLLDLLYEEVEGDTKIQAEAHMAGCESCQQKFAAMGGVRKVAVMLPEPEMPALGYQSLLAEAAVAAKKYAAPEKKKVEESEGLWARLMSGMRFLLSPPVAVAAGLALVVVVSLSINEKAPQPMHSAPRAVFTESPQLVAAPEGEMGETDSATLAPASTPVSAVKLDPRPTDQKDEGWSAKQAKPEAKPIAEPIAAPTKTSKEKTPDFVVGGVLQDKPQEISAPPMPITPTAPNNTSGGSGAKISSTDPVLYEQSLKKGNTAYKDGDLDEAEKQYQTAADNAFDGSREQDIAIAAQVQAQAASKDCDSALSTARKITAASKDVALLAAADCYAAKGNTSTAKELYTEISSMGGTASATAKRNLMALETKLSKPSLETLNKTAPKDPAKNNTTKKK